MSLFRVSRISPRIEVRGHMGNVRRFSVTEYEAALRKARTCAYPKALSFFELMWTLDAPAVHALTCDGQKPRGDEFRIGDWETYTPRSTACWGSGTRRDLLVASRERPPREELMTRTSSGGAGRAAAG